MNYYTARSCPESREAPKNTCKLLGEASLQRNIELAVRVTSLGWSAVNTRRVTRLWDMYIVRLANGVDNLKRFGPKSLK
jgi:hypothetical protein